MLTYKSWLKEFEGYYKRKSNFEILNSVGLEIDSRMLLTFCIGITISFAIGIGFCLLSVPFICIALLLLWVNSIISKKIVFLLSILVERADLPDYEKNIDNKRWRR